jgi:hypothetical protein
MSKISIEGNALGSGTFTIASPNSNSNRTLNLPDSSGTVVVTGGAQTIEFAAGTASAPSITTTGDTNTGIFFPAADTIAFSEGGTEAMRIDSDGDVGIGTTTPATKLNLNGEGIALRLTNPQSSSALNDSVGKIEWETKDASAPGVCSYIDVIDINNFGTAFAMTFATGLGGSAPERARITSGGEISFGTTATILRTQSGGSGGVVLNAQALGISDFARSTSVVIAVNLLSVDGTLIDFRQDGTVEGAISVSGNTVTYGAFCGGHWTQLQEGRGYNPAIPRGTVMSSIGEMAVWKSVEWTETTEHPAIEAVEAVEAVLDEDGNVIEPAVEAVEGKEAWTETFNKRENYFGNLDIGATFEEDGFTKTVVDDGNERLPKVKISDVVGDKAVYGVFQTWDEVEDMLISSLGAFVVRIASGVTVEVGDLLESNGDGCAKVQDDDIIRSKTIGKVTSTVATDTYDDGSYTVPCVLYCG